MPLFKVFKDGSLDACFARPSFEVWETTFQEYEPKAVCAVGGTGNKEEFALEGDQVGCFGKAFLKLRTEYPGTTGDCYSRFVREVLLEEFLRQKDGFTTCVQCHATAKRNVELQCHNVLFEETFPILESESDLFGGAISVGMEEMSFDIVFCAIVGRCPSFVILIVLGIAKDTPF